MGKFSYLPYPVSPGSMVAHYCSEPTEKKINTTLSKLYFPMNIEEHGKEKYQIFL